MIPSSNEKYSLGKIFYDLIPEAMWAAIEKAWDSCPAHHKSLIVTTLMDIAGIFTTTSWLSFSVGSAAIFGFSMLGFNHLDAWRDRRRKGLPQVSRGEGLPVEFGAPVQRSKDEAVSLWCVPIKVNEGNIKRLSPVGRYKCSAYLDMYVQGKVTRKIELTISGAGFGEVSVEAELEAGRVYLVPIAWRSERNNERKDGFIRDSRFVEEEDRNHRRIYVLPPNREKNRYRLRLKCSQFECESPYFYLLRVPFSASNGHFVLEIEYEGEGSQ